MDLTPLSLDFGLATGFCAAIAAGLPVAATGSEGGTDFQWLGSLARIELWILACALIALLALRLLDGRINMKGLLHVKGPAGTGGLSPARVQLLLITLIAAFTIPLNLQAMRAEHKLSLGSSTSVLLLTGSNAFYLARKFINQRVPA